MLTISAGNAAAETPSYPPVRGRLVTETSLEEETQGEERIWPPPHRGIRGGLVVFIPRLR